MIRMRKMLAETPSSPMELRMTALTVCSWCRTISPPAPRGLPCAASLGADHLLLAAVRLVVEGGSGTREIPLGPDDRHLASIMQSNEPGADLCTSGPDCGLMTKGWAVSRHASDVWQCWAMAMESTKLTVHECVKAHFQQGKGTHIRLLRVLSNIAKYRQHVWTWAARPRGTGDSGDSGDTSAHSIVACLVCV